MRALPEKIEETQIGSRKVSRDEAGFLMEPDEWDQEVAQFIADEENLVLGDDHWAVIQFIRDFLEENLVAPDARFAFTFLANRNGLTKQQARKLFFKLFPYGYVKQACKIAGLRQPRAWSTG